MIDYVGRDSYKQRVQARSKHTTPLIEKIKFMALAFPVVFTILFILSQIFDHASRHG